MFNYRLCALAGDQGSVVSPTVAFNPDVFEHVFTELICKLDSAKMSQVSLMTLMLFLGRKALLSGHIMVSPRCHNYIGGSVNLCW